MSDLAALHELLGSGLARDRAFVDAMLRISWARTADTAARAELVALHAVTKSAALRAHAGRRAEIAAGKLRGAALRQCFDEVPLLERDHFVEELLGIAYPPLAEPALERELVGYSPSGYDEIVRALDVTGLAARDHFLDLGCGLGKVVLLAALLTGASCSGIDCNAELCDEARQASRALGVDGLRLQAADARDATLPEADVIFMYLPFTGETLRAVLQRLMRRRARHLCAAALDLRRYPELVAVESARSWLHVYAWR